MTTQPVPPLGALLGYGAMLPLAAGAIGVWLLPAPWTALLLRCTLVWGGAILAFLGGVRRGLSFRTEGGPTAAQVLGMLWLFALAFAALVMPWPAPSCALLLVGYASVAILDSLAAQDGEAPGFFARLRPPQMLVALASLVLLGARAIVGSWA